MLCPTSPLYSGKVCTGCNKCAPISCGWIDDWPISSILNKIHISPRTPTASFLTQDLQ